METHRVALSLPSEARTHVAQTPPIKWGDLDLEDKIARADGAGLDITVNYNESSSHFADQRTASLQNNDATRETCRRHIPQAGPVRVCPE